MDAMFFKIEQSVAGVTLSFGVSVSPETLMTVLEPGEALSPSDSNCFEGRHSILQALQSEASETLRQAGPRLHLCLEETALQVLQDLLAELRP